MARGVEQDPDVGLRLVVCQVRSERDCPGHLTAEIGHLKIEMRHHLLGARYARPHRSYVSRVVLDVQIGDPLAGVQRTVGVIETVDPPPAEVCVEVGECFDIVGVEDHTPPIVTFPAIRHMRMLASTGPGINRDNDPMCDTFVSVTSDRVILGKNSDREPNEAHVLAYVPAAQPTEGAVRCTYISIPQVERTHAVILSKPYWIWGAEMGVNEHGVAIGNEAVFTKAKREKPGLLGMDLLRLALERAATADEAIEVITGLLQRYGQGGEAGHTHRLEYDNSFIVSDRGQAWVLETVGRDWAARRVTHHASISNGLTLDKVDLASPGITGPIREESDFLYTRFSDSAARQCRTDLLAAGDLDVAAAFAILRDHGDPPREPARGLMGQTVCAHAGFGPIRVAQSTGSMVAHVTGDDICVWLTGTSAPCTSVFKPVWFDGGLPEMPEPGREYDAGTMWWRHEVLHRETLRNYSGRLPVYAADRDALEAQFLAADPDDRGAFTAECFATAASAEQRWLKAARAVAPQSLPALYARAWRQWCNEAGLR